MKVRLDDIIEALEMTDDNSEAFLNQKTERIVWISEWDDREEQEAAYEQLDEDGFYRLPTKRDIHEYGIMQSFIDTIPGPAGDDLRRSSRGKGAFGKFKSGLRHYRIEQDWYDYRDKAYRFLAHSWCQENGLDIDE